MHKIILFLLLMLPFSANAELKEYANINVLNKVKSETKTYKMKVGEIYKVQTLSIELSRCDKAPPEETPESGAYITVVEPKKSDAIIFQGWIFASNPSINSLQHPVYDIWLKSCQ